MDPQTALLRGVLVPALVAGAALLLGARPWRPAGGSARAGVGSGAGALAAPALLGALLVAWYGLLGPPPLPWAERTLSGLEWHAWLCAAAAVLLPLGAWLAHGALSRAALRLLLLAALFPLVLGNVYRHQWEGAEAWTATAWIAALAFVAWGLTAAWTKRTPGASAPLALLLVATGTGVCSVLTGSAKIAQLGGAVAAGLGAALVLAWWRPRNWLGESGGAAAWLALAGLLLCAHYYSYLPRLDALLLGLAPCCAWLAELAPLRRLSPRRHVLARVACVLAPVAVAVVRCVLAYEPDPYA